jgi:hypothetical protein
MSLIIGVSLLGFTSPVGIGVRITCLARPKFLTHMVCSGLCDQHTVKPWLSARLDLSPPVRDLKDAAFHCRWSAGKATDEDFVSMHYCCGATRQWRRHLSQILCGARRDPHSLTANNGGDVWE